MLNFKTQKYIFQIQKLVKMVNLITTVKMKMEVTKTEIKVRISTTAIDPTNKMLPMVSIIWMTRQEMAVVLEMAMVTEVGDQTVRQGETMEHQEIKIILQVEVQIENMAIRKMVMVPRHGRLHEKVQTEITQMELTQVR